MAFVKIGLVYGYGQEADGSLNPQTTARCEVAAQLFRRRRIHAICLTVSAQKANHLMADGMRACLIDRAVPNDAILVDPRGGNTAGETDCCLEIMEREVAANPQLNVTMADVEIIPISTWYHLPRIWWLWLWRGRLIRRFGISWRHAHWADLKIEPFKFLNALLRPRRSAKLVCNPTT